MCVCVLWLTLIVFLFVQGLEQMMLRRWMATTWTFPYPITIIPSPLMHCDRRSCPSNWRYSSSFQFPYLPHIHAPPSAHIYNNSMHGCSMPQISEHHTHTFAYSFWLGLDLRTFHFKSFWGCSKLKQYFRAIQRQFHRCSYVCVCVCVCACVCVQDRRSHAIYL